MASTTDVAAAEPTGLGTQAPSLATVALLFLRLGCTSFGGPAVHIAMMEDDVVRRRGWLSHEEFLDLVGATNLIPGPNSTEMAVHIGWRVAGRAGFLIAGMCFILPAVVIVSTLAWAYVRFGTVPEVAGLLYGIKPVVIAVVVQALWRLGRASVKTKYLATVGIFLPAFVFVALSGPLVPLLRRSATAGGFLDGVDVASLALMAVVTWHLGRAALVDPTTIGLVVISACLLLRYRLNSTWLVLAGGAIGMFVALLRDV